MNERHPNRQASWDDLGVAIFLEHSGRRFQVMEYHEAIRHDGPAFELAEVVDGELGPAVVTVLFGSEGADKAETLLTEYALPLPILVSFMTEATQAIRRLS